MLSNATRHRIFEMPLYDRRGAHCLLVVIKATFQLHRGRVICAANPTPVRIVDEYSDPQNGNSSVVAPSDLAEYKPVLDLIVEGRALPPQPALFHDVALRFRERTVPLRVHGPRIFEPDIVGVKIGRSLPFDEQNITYDLAYGGTSEDLSLVELRNIAGRGVAKNSRELEGTPAPQIEHPGKPHTRPSDRHEPVGFGPIAPHWSPRRELFGTTDTKRYRDLIMPNSPEDLDTRYFQQAHHTLQFPAHLSTGEEFMAIGMTRDSSFRFTVPEMRVQLRCLYDQRTQTRACPVDTLFVQPDRDRFEMVARALIPLGRTAGNLLREVHVDDLAAY